VESVRNEPRLQVGPEQDGAAWALAAGVDLLGPVRGSGLRDQTFLARRVDGQVVQLSKLLNSVLLELAASPPGVRTNEEIAEAISAAYGRQLSSDGLLYLLAERLAPMGLVERIDQSALIPTPKSAPLLSIGLRGTLFPARVVQILATILRPLYFTPVVLVVLLGFLVADVILLKRGDLIGAVDQMLATPVLVPGVLIALPAAAILHELGHATACRYGGATPGRIGVGVYIVFPVFFTDVTDSYRLNRGGRLRTDLGGLYFNALTVIGLAIAYLNTGNGLFLLVLLLMQIEMVQQLVPAVRLDGYYVLSDLAGVPDLFARVRPVLRSLKRRQPTDPRVRELKPYARKIVVAWVLMVVPVLAFGSGWLLWSLPVIVPRTWRAVAAEADAFVNAYHAVNLPQLALSAISIVALILPLVGIAILLWRTLKVVGAALIRPTMPSPVAAAGLGTAIRNGQTPLP
jgi:putative peptide zinc metalloprotease protein